MFIQIHIECLQWAWHSPKHRKTAVRIKHLPSWSWHYGKCSLNVEITEIFICFILFYIFLSFLQSHFKSKIYVSFKLLFSLSVTSDSLWDPMDCSKPGFHVHHQLLRLLKLMSIESVIPSNHFILCHPPLLLPLIFPSIRISYNSRFFTSGGQSIGVSASASVLPMNIQDWFPLGLTGWISLPSKGIFKSLLQHHSSKASILRCSAFFMVQLSHPYMTTGKTITLTTWTFVG